MDDKRTDDCAVTIADLTRILLIDTMEIVCKAPAAPCTAQYMLSQDTYTQPYAVIRTWRNIHMDT